jgi:hypothetical protein
MTPTYIPPHLEGKVKDFRQDAAGNISFRHDDAANGLSDPELTRQSISQDQYKKTFDRNYRLGDFNKSIVGQYGGPGAADKSFKESLKDSIVGGIKKGLSFGTATGAGTIGTVGLLSALAGGGAGAMLGAREGSGILNKGALLALLAGTLGAGATAYTQAADARRQAYMSKKASSSVDMIIQALANDRQLTPQQKADALRAIVNLADRDRDDLSRQLRTLGGAGAGVLISRFLVGKGLLSSAVGGILGALIGAASARPPIKYNAMGQVSISNYR